MNRRNFFAATVAAIGGVIAAGVSQAKAIVPAKGFWYAHRPRWRPWRRLSGRGGDDEIGDPKLYRYLAELPTFNYLKWEGLSLEKQVGLLKAGLQDVLDSPKTMEGDIAVYRYGDGHVIMWGPKAKA